ncbi:hypothetical protein [Kaistia terrae]|uniref:Uncharacterized protein n=1 Tax=Kaistia terrae TaxID=537017 RepID=A0ABW0Q6A0_9HYPH|nr:hypothetical protein [Kaistia terrae]MCX5581357.1 hypothetical protein [Kaistia terrae]
MSPQQSKARPILFSGPMVRALLDGRKTQTRRLMKPQPALVGDDQWHIPGTPDEFRLPANRMGAFAPDYVRIKLGDRLWVREAHALLPRTAYRMSIGTGTIAQREHPTDGYTAAVFREGFDRSGRPAWRPSIHMPRWASRLTLAVTDVRVERLQGISDADAEDEGIDLDSDFASLCNSIADAGYSNDLPNGSVQQAVFRHLWETINCAGSWEANPWVAAYTFTVSRTNIDEVR